MIHDRPRTEQREGAEARFCWGCGEMIDPARRSDARFCPGSRCRMRFDRSGVKARPARPKQRPKFSEPVLDLFERIESERIEMMRLMEADETCIKGSLGRVGTPMGGPGGLTAWGVYLRARGDS